MQGRICFEENCSMVTKFQLFPRSVFRMRVSQVFQFFSFYVLKFCRFQIAHLRRFRACFFTSSTLTVYSIVHISFPNAFSKFSLDVFPYMNCVWSQNYHFVFVCVQPYCQEVHIIVFAQYALVLTAPSSFIPNICQLSCK